MATASIISTLDAYLLSSSPTTNFGTGTTAIIGGLTTVRVGIFQFDVSAYAGQNVSSVVFRRECTVAAASGPPFVLSYVGLADGALSEADMTYNKRNASTSWASAGGDDFASETVFPTYNAPTATGLVDVDVTTMFLEAVGFGYTTLFPIRDRQQSGTSRTWTCATREHDSATKPTLIITYTSRSVVGPGYRHRRRRGTSRARW